MSDEIKDECNESTARPIQRASEIKRAYRIRLRLKKKGAVVSDEDREWLKTYDATKRGGGAQVEETDTAEDAGDDNPPAEGGTPEVDVTGSGDMGNPPPPPPRVAATVSSGNRDGDTGDSRTGNSRGDWRAKYRQGNTADGREKTVLAISSQWMAVLDFMAAQIKLSGSQPIVDPASLRNAIVLTVDDFLPQKIQIKPVHIAACGSTLLLAQRFKRNKQVGEAYERGAHIPPPAPPSPPSPPPPQSAPEPTPQPDVADVLEANGFKVTRGAEATMEAIRDAADLPPPPIAIPVETTEADYVPGRGEVF